MPARKVTDSSPEIQAFIGQRFGRLVVVSFAGVLPSSGGKNRQHFNCLCDCGISMTVNRNSLRSGNTKSCGCLNRDNHLNQKGTPTHGQTKSREFAAWAAMIQRCHNPNNDAYADYGGRAITVCDRWRHSFENFIADMGPRPSAKHTLDRFPDNNGPYEKSNCRWATMKEQAQNRRNSRLITHDGKTLCFAEWERILGFSSGLIRYRLNTGWPIHEILMTPPATRPSKLLTHQGKALCASQWERLLGYKRGLLKYRLKAGWTIEKSLTTPPK